MEASEQAAAAATAASRRVSLPSDDVKSQCHAIVQRLSRRVSFSPSCLCSFPSSSRVCRTVFLCLHCWQRERWEERLENRVADDCRCRDGVAEAVKPEAGPPFILDS